MLSLRNFTTTKGRRFCKAHENENDKEYAERNLAQHKQDSSVRRIMVIIAAEQSHAALWLNNTARFSHDEHSKSTHYLEHKECQTIH